MLVCDILIPHIVIWQFKNFNITPIFPLNTKLGYICNIILANGLSKIENIGVTISSIVNPNNNTL